MKTPPEPKPTHDTTDRPGPFKRVGNVLAWYTPELTVAAASAGAAATVWAPLGVIAAACGARIATNQINLARANRRVRRQITEQHTDRGQLDPSGEHDEHAASTGDTPHAGDGATETGETADALSAGESTSGERPGWEVAG